MQFKKLLPGLILAIVFIGAFIIGLNGFSGSNPVSKTSSTQPALSGGTSSELSGNPVTSPSDVPGSVTTPADIQPAPVTEQPVVIIPAVEQPNNTTQPAEDKKSHEEKENDSEGDD